MLVDVNETVHNHFQMLREHQAMMLLVEIETGKIIESNSAAENFYGFSYDEFKIKTIFDLEHNRVNDIKNSDLLKSKSVSYETEHIKKSGEIAFINIHSSIIEVKNVNYIYMIINDISESKKTEEKLKESEARLHFAIEASNMGIWDWNLETNQVYFSKRWKEMLGFAEDEIRSDLKEWENRVHKDDINKAFEDVKNHLEAKSELYINEHRVLCKNGEYKWILDKGQVISRDANGKPLRMIGTHSDIHSEKTLKDQLFESELLYHSIFDRSPIGIELYDNKGFLVDTNQACNEIFGVINKNELKNFNLFDDPNIDNVVLKSLKNGKSVNYETEFDFNKVIENKLYSTSKTGKIWLKIIITPLGELHSHGFLVQVQDISNLKLTEMQLANSKNNFEKFFNNADYYAFVLDMQGIMLQVNDLVFEKLGYVKEDLIGKSVLEIHPEERRAEAMEIVINMLNGSADSCPIPLISKNNELYPVETRVTIGEWDNQPVILGISKDISKLKLSEEKFAILFKLNPSPSGLSDLVTGKYIEVNKAFYTFFGFTEEEVIGKTAYELGIMDFDSRDQVLKFADSSGNVHNAPLTLKTKDGVIKRVHLSSENIYIQEKKLRFTVVTDITELKNIELELKRSVDKLSVSKYSLEATILQKNSLIEELEDAKRSLRETIDLKDKFFKIISHDLRSPFNGLLGISELLEKEIDNLSIKDLKQLIAALHSASKSTFNLINELLDWSRLQTGEMPFNPREEDIAELIETEVVLYQIKALSKNITLETSFDKGMITMLDRSMMATVLRNLISNAIKFTKPNGIVKISSYYDNHNIIISIEDNGIGIDDKNLKKLFCIDCNVSTLGTAGEKGTGLGLILCKEFVEKHQGMISVESEINIGTKFSVTLPIN